MKVALIPHSKELYENPHKGWMLYEKVKEKYKNTDIEWLRLSIYSNWDEIDIFVFYNFQYSWGVKILRKINALGWRNRIVYCMIEPDTVVFFHNRKWLYLIRRFTDCIITWDSRLVDNRNVFFALTHGWDWELNPKQDIVPKPFCERKLLCNISSNLQSKNRRELYSERKRIIKWFDENHSDEFELYGKNWDKERFRSYRGTCVTKSEVYERFKFALALENTYGANGYITEKILDCIMCRIVPIYAGANNIDEYIPKDAYIDYNKFNSIGEMYDYLKNMGEEEYSRFIFAQNSFINEKRYEPFTAEVWGKSVIDAINRYNKEGKKRTSGAWFFIIAVIAAIYRCSNLSKSIIKKLLGVI